MEAKNYNTDMKIDIKKEILGYSAHIPEYCISTEGDTMDELLFNIQEALSMCNVGNTQALQADHFSLIY